MTPSDTRWYAEYTQRQRRRGFIHAFLCIAFTLAVAYVGLAVAGLVQ